MEGPILKSMTVGTLLNEKYKFYIPYYQRGYRWRKDQVINLLEDIRSFVKNNDCMNKYYSLQPLVVTESEGIWSVIDGQQRLTTIFLLAKHILRDDSNCFSISYESRQDIENYLEKIAETDKEENIEQHFLFQAYRVIQHWWDTELKDEAQTKHDIEGALMAKNEHDRWRLQFIWYEIKAGNEDEIELFSRLNKGRLSLTSAELIKAEFCSEIHRKFKEPDKRKEEEARFFREWNEIENQFQDDAFWSFICNEKNSVKEYETRIEYLFDLLVDQEPSHEDVSVDDSYKTFHLYSSYKSKKTGDGPDSVRQARNDIWQFYQTLLGWYHDRQFFHLIGFLVQIGESLVEIKKIIEKEKTRKDMISALRKKIFDSKSLNFALDGINFNSQKHKIRNILLLFNIEYLLQNQYSNQRFQFDMYQQYQWDLEHICSQTSVPGDSDRKKWTEKVLRYILKLPLLEPEEFLRTTETEKPKKKPRTEKQEKQTQAEEQEKKKKKEEIIETLQKAIDSRNNADPRTEEDQLIEELFEYYNDKNTGKDFGTLYEKVRKFFKESDNMPEDDLTNLTLLDSGTNRGYGNAPFAVKRQYIIEQEKAGCFIPPCTRDVFMKTFSTDVANMFFWNPKTDGVQHLKTIGDLFAKYYNIEAKNV